MASTTRPRLLAATALGAALTLGGCSFVNPIQTLKPYAASDGLRVEIDEGVKVENLMVLTEAEGEPGRVLGAVVNNTDERVEVSLQLGDAEEVPVTVEAREVVNFTDEEIVLESTAAAPGALLETTITGATQGSTTVGVPVLDGTLEPYDEHVPAG